MNDETPVLNGNEEVKDQSLKFKDSRRARVGKIARLPLAVRQQLNQRLQNGEQGKLLVQWLNGLPEVQASLTAQFNGQSISEPNLTAWRQGGYRDWEEEQRTLLAVEREKLGFRRELHQKVRDEEIWQWVQKEQNRDKILERLLTPKQLEEEQERWNERERNRLREILGLPLKPIPVPIQANCA